MSNASKLARLFELFPNLAVLKAITTAPLTVAPVTSVNGSTGAVVLTTGVSSVNGAAGAVVLSGTPVQVGYASVAGVVALTTAIPADNTIPQITEGTEVLTLAFTPKFATSTLLIEADFIAAETSNTGDYVVGALFVDSTANALVSTLVGSAQAATNLTAGTGRIKFQVAAGSTAARTYRLRAGNSVGAGLVGSGPNSYTLGGTILTTITVTEIKA